MPAPQKRRRFHLPAELAWERIVSLQEAYDLSSISADCWRRHYSHLLIKLSPRRWGVKLKHVLNIGQAA
jgi:hypothetical protein